MVWFCLHHPMTKQNHLEFIWFGDTWLVPGCCWWRCSECREQSGARGHAAQPLHSDPRLLSLSASTMQQHAAPRHPRQALAPQYSPISIILIFLITFNKHIITNCSSPSWHHISEWWLRLLCTMLCLIMKRSAYPPRTPQHHSLFPWNLRDSDQCRCSVHHDNEVTWGHVTRTWGLTLADVKL